MSGVIVRARFRPRAPADGAVVELRVCGGSGVRADFEGQQWWPLIIPGGLPVLKARLGWDGQRFDGGAVTTVGQMRIADSDGRLEPYKGLIWKGATAEIWTAPLKQRNGVELTADGDFTLLWQGLADDIKVEGQICTIVLADAGEKLRVPVLDQEYDGAGDLGGIAERKGGKIGRGWGRCPSVKGRLIDSAYWIYDFGITADGAATIHAVRDGGYGLAVQTTAASLAALRALALDDGKVATCVVANRVLVRWWTRPKFLPSADITFGATTRPAEIAASVLAARAPSVAFGAGQVAAYNAVQAASCGRYVDPDADASLTVEGLLDWLFNGLGSWWQLSAAGTLEIGRYGEGGVSYTVDETRVIDVDRQGIIMPVARRSLGYQPNAAIHGDSDIAASITAGDVQGLGWLATSSATGTLLLNAAYTAVAATAVTGNSGEAVLCATDAAGDQVPGTDFAYSWAGRARRVARHPGHDAASPTIHTQQAGKKGFIVHHHGGNGGAFLAPAGALVRNKLLQSESLSVSPWSSSGASVSINAVVDHYGVQGLDRIIEDTSTGSHFIDQTYTHGGDPTGLSWTLSAVVQAGGRSRIQLCFPSAGGVFAMETVCNFDLATGTRISNTANVTGYGIIDLGGGLYRVWMTAPATGNAPIVSRIFLLDDAGNRSYTGSGGLLYAGHVQLEQASTFTTYQCTTTGPAQRTAFCYKVGAQWYYDRGDGTQVAFTPDSNHIALGWLATSSDDTISGGGLLSPVTLTEAAFPAADVTAENTAANTAAVGSTAAADVEGAIANLSPTTGRALSSFLAENGIGFAQIFDAGEARDGDTYTWPTTPTSVPRVVPMPAGAAATAGQNITIQAENVTLSGFTFRAKSQGVTPSSTITDTTEGTGGGSNPDRVINRSNSNQPYDNRWRFQFSVSVPEFSPGEPGSAQVLFFLKQSGVWVQSGNRYYSASGTYTYEVISSSVDFGAGEEFGISIGVDYSPGASITDFLNVKYTLGTVTETSLTPAGASPVPWIALI